MLQTMMWILTGICLATTIGLFTVLPAALKRVFTNPLLGAMLNFGVSAMIGWFVGDGLAAGSANLLASLFFAAYTFIAAKTWLKWLVTEPWSVTWFRTFHYRKVRAKKFRRCFDSVQDIRSAL